MITDKLYVVIKVTHFQGNFNVYVLGTAFDLESAEHFAAEQRKAATPGLDIIDVFESDTIGISGTKLQ